MWVWYPMTSYTFVHEGRPQVKERPRAGRNGRKLYTPVKTLDAQGALAHSYDGPLFEGPIGIVMAFNQDNTRVSIEDYGGGMSPLRGDIDNYVKLVLDGLEGIAYPNDRQVMYLSARKMQA